VIGARACALTIAASLAAAAPVHADTTDRQQIIITDAVSDVLIASVASAGLTHRTHGLVTAVGLAGALFGGPIIHAAHDDWGRAGWSLGARVGMPAIGVFVGGEVCDDHDVLGCLADGLIGAAIGLVGAQVLDATVIARGSTTGQTPAVRMLSFGFHF
jgi:hypothetical protein